MTTLVVDTLINNEEVDQDIRLYRSTYLKNVRIHIFKQGTFTDGQFDLEIYENAVLLDTNTITYTQLNSISGSYWHGWLSFSYDDALFLSVDPTTAYSTYTFKFVLRNRTDDSDIYMGLCRDYEKYVRNTLSDYRYPPLYGNETSDGITADANTHPLSLELYNLR